MRALSPAWLWLCLAACSSALAGTGAGFRIDSEKFSLTVSYDRGADPEAEYLAQHPGGLFFDCLQWIHANRARLSSIEPTVVADFTAVRRTGGPVLLDIGERNFTLKISAADEFLDRLHAELLGGARPKLGAVEPLELFVLVGNDQDAVASDVFFGALPSTMYFASTRRFFGLFWSRQAAERRIPADAAESYEIRPIVLSRRGAETLPVPASLEALAGLRPPLPAPEPR